MRKFLVSIVNTITSFVWKIRNKGHVILSNVNTLGSQIKVSQDCKLEAKDTRLVHSTINIVGDQCSCHIAPSIKGINHSRIKISGSNNRLTIEGGYLINHINIVIDGDSCNICIGEGLTISSGHIVCMGQDNYIHIGNDCMLAENVNIWATDSHQITDLKGNLINPSRPIIIEDHVWLGQNTSILKGVTIGHDCILGMNTMVTKNCEPNSLYVGAPARKIKESVTWSRTPCNV